MYNIYKFQCELYKYSSKKTEVYIYIYIYIYIMGYYSSRKISWNTEYTTI